MNKHKDPEAERRERELLAVIQKEIRSNLKFVRLNGGPNDGKFVFDVYPELAKRFADA